MTNITKTTCTLMEQEPVLLSLCVSCDSISVLVQRARHLLACWSFVHRGKLLILLEWWIQRELAELEETHTGTNMSVYLNTT